MAPPIEAFSFLFRSGMSKLLHKWFMWLQVFIPTKQEWLELKPALGFSPAECPGLLQTIFMDSAGASCSSQPPTFCCFSCTHLLCSFYSQQLPACSFCHTPESCLLIYSTVFIPVGLPDHCLSSCLLCIQL